MDIQQEPIQLKTTKSLKTFYGAIMQQHGCLVEERCVTLPIGSTRTLRRPSLQPATFWYDIVLPDRFRMLEAHNQHRDVSMLFIQLECVRTEKGKK